RLVPIIEEYTTLLRCLRIQVDKAYARVAYVPTLLKKLMNITGMSEQWVVAQIKVDIFALSIYGLVVFPKALGYVEEAVADLFDRLNKRVTPIPAILAETFRSLNACRRAGKGRKLLPIKRISGYTKTRRHHEGEMDDDSLKSPREGCRAESPMDDP
ncbi:hypothetical protein Golob_027342, partial [Gossypium lobatum]|nr:hypothetical protein [Gossypium lobatum]